MTTSNAHWRLVASHLVLRKVIGIAGVALPVILIVWGFALAGAFEFQPSLSDYYVLRTRDAFVGILFTIACFLFAYRGHDPTDNRAGHLGCLFALGVALFPNTNPGWERVLHFTCATGLFLVLSFFSLRLFTKSDKPKEQRTHQKNRRNRIYVGCGVCMLLCIALIAIHSCCPKDSAIGQLRPVLWLETIALWAFGFSWFVKGETLVKDRVPHGAGAARDGISKNARGSS